MKVQEWTGSLTDSVTRVAEGVIAYLPSILGSAALIVFGWILARLLRSATQHLSARALQRLARTRSIDEKVEQSRSYQAVPDVTGRVVYWTVFVFFLAAAIEALGLPAVSNVLGLVIALLPRALAGVMIFFVGLWLGDFIRSALSHSAIKAGVGQGELLGRAAQVFVWVIAMIVALDQVGIDSTVLITTVVTVFAATFGAAALAFGLGARATVSNIIAAHYVRRNYQTGDFVKLGDQEGRIMEVGTTAVLMEGTEGRVLVPAQRFSEEVSVLLRKEV